MSKVLCLLYHRVCCLEDDIYNITVSVDNFEEQIKYLSENYQIVRFEEDWDEISGKAIAITFDDGYADNYQNALPILEKYKVPATVFIATGSIGKDEEFWYDELERLLTTGDLRNEYFKLIDPVYEYRWETKTKEQRLEVALTLRWLLRKDPSLNRRESWFRQLRDWAQLGETGRYENLPLNEQQLRELGNSPYITVGGHTVTHRSLGALTKEEQKGEIEQSILYLEKVIDKKIEVFSYPFGQQADYTENTIELLKEYGIKKAATTEARCAESENCLFKIPRLKVENLKIQEFENFIKNNWSK